MPPHGDGDDLASFTPSIIPHSTQDPAQTPTNAAMDIDLETLRGHSDEFGSFSWFTQELPQMDFSDILGHLDNLGSFSWPSQESPQIDFSEIIDFTAPADDPEDRRPCGTDADILGVNDAAAPQAAPPVPVGGGGHAAPWCATGTTEIEHLEEEDAQRRLNSCERSDVEQRLFAEVESLTATDEKLAPAPGDGCPSSRDADMAELNTAVTQPTALAIDVIRRITNNFSDDLLIGEGGFGRVYKGVLPNGDKIAVKRFKSRTPGLQDVVFENEAQHLMRVKHPNIVQFVGYCYETKMELVKHNGTFVRADKSEELLCLEYMPNGSLRHHLSDEASGLDWNTRYKIIKGICYGLRYLHEECSIIHMDLKPANILLDDHMVPKLADFGLSRLFPEEHTQTCTTSLAGTLGYMPPEYIARGFITKKLDIFSLGVIIIEIIMGHKDYPTAETETATQQYIDLVLDRWRHRLRKAQGYTSQDFDYHQIKICIQIALLCVKSDRVKRPTIKEIMEMLERSDKAYQNEREITNNFSHDQLLGKGGFSNVYKGVLRNGDTVAVKRLAVNTEAPEEAQRWFDLWKSTVLQDLSRTSFQKFILEELSSRLSSWERMNSRDFQNGELADSKGMSIVRFTPPNAKGRKPHQAGWKENSMKGMRGVADPLPQLPGQQLHVGLKKTLEGLDDDGKSNKWRAHEYTPLLPSDDGTNRLVSAEISLRVQFKEDEPPSSSKHSRTGDLNSGVWDHMTQVHAKVTPKDGSRRKKPYYKVMHAICHHCDQFFNANSKDGTKNQHTHLKSSCKGNCNCSHSQSTAISTSQGYPKVTMFQKKPFPLYEHLESLYAGSIATGDLNFTSTEPPNMTAPPPIERGHSEQSTHNTADGSDSVGITFATKPFSQIEVPEVQPAPSYPNLEEQESGSGRKHKQSQMVAKFSEVIDIRKKQMEKNQEQLDEKYKKADEYSVEKCIPIVETMEDEVPEVHPAPSYPNLEEQERGSGRKRKQSQMAAKFSESMDIRKKKKEKNQEQQDEEYKKTDEYSVEKCIAIVETMEGLTIVQKADAIDLFQFEMNRQIFMGTKNPDVRLVWLKKKISEMS